MVNRQVAIHGLLIGIANFSIYQKDLVVHLDLTCEPSNSSNCKSSRTTELSMTEVILGAYAEVGGGTRIVPLD